ncbi:O-antigen translocase [Flavobacterium psychrotolerans]|uniref:O-antigen translocase n=1 Tax=Flavobacterium psychrotolerans TaxID=2169410 RepID=A0A2U1JMI7_9FLAO|nr:O-antigen translocase [Flavobacterium psychrotolerans]PWA06093.1 O-antigen translocase [Flavobacterium psychrotolerans]
MNFIKTIARTPLFKITSLNSISILLKIGIGLITSKILAIFIGPSGMALSGNLRNFLTSTESIATLGFQNGIVKYIVKNKDKEEELKKIISTVFLSLITVTLLSSIVLFFFSSYWNDYIFGNTLEYASIFKILALVLPWYVVTVFLLAIINGLGKFKNVIYINIIGNSIGLIFSVFMIWQFRTFGALLSIIIPPSLLFFVAFYFINKEIHFINSISTRFFDFQVLKNLSSYSLMALVSSVFGPLVFLAIRNNIIEKLGIESAGYWEAISRISTYYFMFISSILTVYFFPKLAFATTKKATKNVFLSYYKGILPLFIVGMVILYFLRFFIVKLLFTNVFLPVTGLFFWQLLGDTFKAASLVLGYQFFAKKLTIAFIISETISLVIMFFLSNYLIGIYQIEGVVMAHAINYFIYLIGLLFYFRKSLL